MSIDFTGVKSLTIPEGIVTKVVRKADGSILWEKSSTNIQTFTIKETTYDPVIYWFEEGMTWEDWVNSDYNTGYSGGEIYADDWDGLYCVLEAGASAYIYYFYYTDESRVNKKDLITANYTYLIKLDTIEPI